MMDGSTFAPTPVERRRSAPLTFVRPGVPPRFPEPRDVQPERLPEREWSLSAGQVVFAVLAIVAACEVIGLLS